MLTMSEVADQTGLSLNTVWNAENNKRKSRINTLRVLLRFYELQHGRNQATKRTLQELGVEPLDSAPSSTASKPHSIGRTV